MKILSAILLLILSTVFFPKAQVMSDNELKFKKRLADTLPQIKDVFEINDDSLTLIIKEHKLCEIGKDQNNGAMVADIISLLKEYSEPSFKNYGLEIIKETHFEPSEIPTLIYDSWSGFPLIKVTHGDISISYEEIRGRINSASIINQRTNDTIFVQWTYDKNKIKKQILTPK